MNPQLDPKSDLKIVNGEIMPKSPEEIKIQQAKDAQNGMIKFLAFAFATILCIYSTFKVNSKTLKVLLIVVSFFLVVISFVLYVFRDGRGIDG